MLNTLNQVQKSPGQPLGLLLLARSCRGSEGGFRTRWSILDEPCTTSGDGVQARMFDAAAWMDTLRSGMGCAPADNR